MKRLLLLLNCFVALHLFAAVDYNVKDFGAKGDGKTLDHIAINAAIEKCVYIPHHED